MLDAGELSRREGIKFCIGEGQRRNELQLCMEGGGGSACSEVGNEGCVLGVIFKLADMEWLYSIAVVLVHCKLPKKSCYTFSYNKHVPLQCVTKLHVTCYHAFI